MSGILGMWNLDGRPADRGVLGRMTAALAHRGPNGSGQWIRGSVGMASQLLRVTPESQHETQPLVDDTGCALVFDGRLDNREELFTRLRAHRRPPRDASDPALILAAYHDAGTRLPEWLLGDFALALFDPRQPQLLLASHHRWSLLTSSQHLPYQIELN